MLLLSAAAYLAWWPTPIEPMSWIAPADPGYTGAHAVNNKLASLQVVSLGADAGPEHIVLAGDGKLYLAVAGGNILRMNPDGTGREVYANTQGRVLGFAFDAAGNLVAADAHKGLLSVAPDRTVTVLTDSVEGRPIRFADAVVIARSGKMYFSDASTRFAAPADGSIEHASLLDIVEQSATGRVLEYDPATRATRVVAKGLSFANGVALSQDETALFVAETGRYRVWKIAVSSDNLDVSQGSSQASVFLDNLPGFPDNLMRGMDGKTWLGLFGPRAAVLDDFSGNPFIRKVLSRLPSAMVPPPKPYGHVIAFTEDGKVVADLQDPSGAYPKTTGVTETPSRLYVQTLNSKGLGWLPR